MLKPTIKTVYDHFECFKTIVKAGADLKVQANRIDQHIVATLLKYATHISYAKLFVTCGGLLHCDVTKAAFNHQCVTRDRTQCLDYLSKSLGWSNEFTMTGLFVSS